MSSDQYQKITHLLPQQIPDYVQEFYPLFVIFVTKYFNYLQNTSTGVQHSIQTLELNRDIDTTANSLAKEFLHTYVPNLPDTAVVDDTILVKYFRQFYQLKGSEKSFRLFFRAFFNDEIDIIYPRNYLFKPSASTWYVEKTIRVTKNNGGDPEELKHTLVTGLTSLAYATVNDVIHVNALGGTEYHDLVLEPMSVQGTFVTGETIRGVVYDFINNTSSIITTTSLTGVLSADGRFKDDFSHLSANQLLQDSSYYQQFSYVVRTHEERSRWFDAVLSQLHPSGTRLFNEYLIDEDSGFSSGVTTTSIAKTTRVESTVKIPSIKTYLTVPSFTFDRTADQYTGTSTTQISTSTGYATIAYTSFGSVSYVLSYDYPGENITWGLQKVADAATFTVTEITRPDGASFDKQSRAVATDPQLITWPIDCNSSIVNTLYTGVSSNLAANTMLTSFSSQTLRYSAPSLPYSTSIGNMIMLVTWVKNSQGNNVAGESNNAVVVSFSSNVSIIPYFDDVTQRNLKRIALGDSLDYNKLLYLHTSNSITANLTSDIAFTSTSISGQAGKIVFKPYNWDRGQSYDRLSIRFEIDKPLQLNTSLTETFSTNNITASGLISTWSSVSTSVSVNSFYGNTSNAQYAFGSNCFVFNGPWTTTSQSRFIVTRTFPSVNELTASLRYIVGDGYNSGEIPDSGEDLEIQYSINSGSSWLTAHKLWVGSTSNLWTFGTTSLVGKTYIQTSSNIVNGVGTLFSTDLSVGDVITINSGLTTAYTVTSILGNNNLTVTPTFVDNFLGLISSTGTISGGIGGDNVSGVGTNFTAILNIGDRIAFVNSDNTTAYTITAVIDNTNLTFTPTLVNAYTTSILYRVSGVNAFRKLPASEQFATTSVSVFSSAASTSVIMRVIQNYQTTLNDDVYAIDDLNVTSYRYQSTTGIVNISVVVSSNSTLNTSDTDFFTVTTIGT